MTGGSLGIRSGSYGSLDKQLQNNNSSIINNNGVLPIQSARKPSKMLKEKERLFHSICKFAGRKKVGMLLLCVISAAVFGWVLYVGKGEDSQEVITRQNIGLNNSVIIRYPESLAKKEKQSYNITSLALPPPPPPPPFFLGYTLPPGHPCNTFTLPPPPADKKRTGPRPCPVCYLPVEEAIALMPKVPSYSPVLQNLTYIYEENLSRETEFGGSEFGGYPTLKQRSDSYDIRESMRVHCGFVRGSKPGRNTGYDMDEEDLHDMEQCHGVVVASAIFGNFDEINQPRNISDYSRETVCFYMFIDEETEAYLKSTGKLDSSKKIGIWRTVVIHNPPYKDAASLSRSLSLSLPLFYLSLSPSFLEALTRTLTSNFSAKHRLYRKVAEEMQHQRLKQQQQQALMQQALLQQHSLYHPGLLAPPQIEPIPSGNLPPGFDPSTCRSVYVGNIHTQVTEPLLQEVFASTGAVESCKLIRKEKSSYGFVHYFDRRSAALAILSLNGRQLFGQPIKVNWAYASGQREDTSGHFNIFVGDLSPEVTDATLFACFSVYSSCSDARVMWDQKTGRSRGFGFVSFRNQQDAQSAINDLNGKWLASRQIRCNWATKGAGTNEDKQSSDAKSVVELTNGSSEDGKEPTNNEAPENNPQYTTVYVGNLAPEVTQLDLHRHFHCLGVGVIEEVRLQRDKGFGFVRFNTHGEAALAIQMGNTQSNLCGRQIKCSWGSKPTPPGTVSNPLPPPAAAVPLPGLSATDLLSYERQLAMSKMGGVHALMHPQGQIPLKQGAMGMGTAGASQAIYDGGFQNVAAAQQLMYYQ